MSMPAANGAEAIIRVEGVDAGYDGNAILDGLGFEVRAGEVFGILGGSGCGKSTLMKHMIGLLPPVAGRITIGGDDIVTADEEGMAAIRRRFGVMYQSGALFGSMTLLENVRLPIEEYTDLPDDAIDLIARRKLELVGLEAFTGHRLPPRPSVGGLGIVTKSLADFATSPADIEQLQTEGRWQRDARRQAPGRS